MVSAGPARGSIPYGGTLIPKPSAIITVISSQNGLTSAGRSRLGPTVLTAKVTTGSRQGVQQLQARNFPVCCSSGSQPDYHGDNCGDSDNRCGAQQQPVDQRQTPLGPASHSGASPLWSASISQGGSTAGGPVPTSQPQDLSSAQLGPSAANPSAAKEVNPTGPSTLVATAHEDPNPPALAAVGDVALPPQALPPSSPAAAERPPPPPPQLPPPQLPRGPRQPPASQATSQQPEVLRPAPSSFDVLQDAAGVDGALPVNQAAAGAQHQPPHMVEPTHGSKDGDIQQQQQQGQQREQQQQQQQQQEQQQQAHQQQEQQEGGPHLNGHTPLNGAGMGPGSAGAPNQQLPPLRLDFLDCSKWLQDWLPGTNREGSAADGQGSSGRRPAPRQGSGSGGPRRSRGAAGGRATPQSRDERIRQLVYAASTLMQLRAVCERHLPFMSPVTATIALSRLAGLTAATQRLQRAQMRSAAAGGGSGGGGSGFATANVDPDGAAAAGPGSSESQPATSSPASASSSAAPALPSAVRRKGPAAVAVTGSTESSNGAGGAAEASAAGGGVTGRTRRQAGAWERDRGTRTSHVGSVLLMRRLLKHIAHSMTGGGGSGNGAVAVAVPGRAGGAGEVGAASPPRHHWPPDHRARTAGTVLVTLARVGWRPTAEDFRALYDILDAARPDLFLASPLQLARIATSLPALRLQPSFTWLDHFAAVSRSKMYCTGPAHLAAYVWCLAKLRHYPGELWLYSLTDQLQRDGKLLSASAGHLCQLLWALNHLGFSADEDWTHMCRRAVEAVLLGGPGSASGGGGGGGNGAEETKEADEEEEEADGLGRMEVPDDVAGPREDGPRAAAVAMGRAATAAVAAGEGEVGPEADNDPDSAPGHLASLLLWSVRTGTAPGPATVEACLVRLQPHLRTMRRGQLLRLLLALSESGHRPSEEFLGKVLAAAQPKLALLNAHNQVQLLLAASQLRFIPSQSWLKVYLEASRAQLRNYLPSHVTATFQVFAGWQLRPPRPYLEDLIGYTGGLLPRFSPRGLATVLHSMSCLGIKPPRRWLVRALEVLAEAVTRGAVSRPPAAATGSAAADTADSGYGLYGYDWDVADAASAGGPWPSPSSGAGGDAGSAGQGPQQQRQQQRATLAAALVTAVCSLRGIVQMDEERGAGGAGPAAAAAAAGAASSSGSRLVLVPPQAVAAAAAPPAAAAAVAAAANTDAGTALLPYELWSSVKRLTDLSRDLLDVMTASELARFIKALARVHFYPGRDFMWAHSRATARSGAQLSPADKEAVAKCYSRLAGLAPLMAAEARRQAEARQARASVLVGSDPWVS